MSDGMSEEWYETVWMQEEYEDPKEVLKEVHAQLSGMTTYMEKLNGSTLNYTRKLAERLQKVIDSYE